MELRQAVDRALEQVGPRMVEAVPARVVGRVAQPEVGPQVDDRGAGRDEVRGRARPRCRGAARGTRRRPAGAWRRPSSSVVARCGWMPPIGSWSRSRPWRPTMSTSGWRASSRIELAADVAGRADDPDPDAPRTAGRIDPAQGARLAQVADTERVDRRHGRMTIQRRCIVMQERSGLLVGDRLHGQRVGRAGAAGPDPGDEVRHPPAQEVQPAAQAVAGDREQRLQAGDGEREQPAERRLRRGRTRSATG